MKQDNAKRPLRWLPLVIGLVVLLAVVGVVLSMVLQPGQQAEEPTEAVGGRPMLYWNVDRKNFIGDEESAGLSTREAAEDGLYHIRFAIDGELVEYTTADKRLVNVIDTYDVMGLVLDDHDIVDAVDPETIAVQAYDGVIVKSLKGNVLMGNTSLAMNGMEVGLRLCDLTKIINVELGSDKLGQLDELEPMDRITVYTNLNDEVTHIFMTKRRPAIDVYWRADKFYDSAAGVTTRVPDENGVYTIPFAIDGKQVQLKCRDKDLVSEIDKPLIYGCPMGLVFDAEGYIVAIEDAAVAMRGMLAASGHHVTGINGDTIDLTYLLPGNNTGDQQSFTVSEDRPVYNCCIGGSADFIGEPTKLQEYDRVMVFTDLEGEPVLIYVMYRMANTPMYYNMTPMYDWTNAVTTRQPDKNGYYVFEMSVNGKQVKLRTKDKALASKIDGVSYGLMGLEVEGDIIKRFYTAYVVAGADTYGAGTDRFITDITGTIVSSVTMGYDYDAPSNLIMTPQTQIYDISGYPGTKIGEKTTVQKGDQVRILVDYNDNIAYIYVVNRYTGWPVYYNYSRQYAATGTTRVADADGYYVYEMASEGKTVTVKTKNKDLADYIDKQYPGIVALKVKGGIIQNAAPAVSSVMFGRMTDYNGRFMNFNDDGTYSFTLPSTGKTYSVGVVEKPVVYNCSLAVKNFVGEKGSVQEGDQIICIQNDQLHKVEQMFVLSRKLPSKFYYLLNPKYNTVMKETTRQPDAEGYYVFDITVEGQVKQFKTKDKAVATAVDSKGAMPFGMTVSGDTIKLAFPYNYIKGVKSMAGYSLDIDRITAAGKVEMSVYLPTSDSFGRAVSLPIAPNYKAYDVSAYAPEFGKQVKLNKGDRVVCFINEKDQVEWFYIWYRNTHIKGAISYCEHCGKDVYWQPFTGTAYQIDTHVYLTHDMNAGSVLIGDDNPENQQAELILDLNGKTLSTVGMRSFIVQGGTLSVVDTVGGGKMVGRTDTENKTTGANVMVLSGGTLNLYSGMLCDSNTATQIEDAGMVFVGANSTFNMYGGTVIGGKVTGRGGNIFCEAGTFNMYGGKITGGQAAIGGNLYLGAATFNMEGGTIDGDVAVTNENAKITISGNAVIGKGVTTGLQLSAGVKLPLDSFTVDTKVTVEATGVFTDKLTNAASYLDRVTAFDNNFPVFVHEGTLACGHMATCEDCGEEVFWSRFSPAACVGDAHLVLTENATLDAWILVNENDNIVLDLNGKTLSAGVQADRLFVVYGSLSVQDSKTGGKLVGRVNDKTAASGLVMLQNPGKMNLYGGTLCASETAANMQSGGLVYVGYNTVFNMYGGTVTGGKAQLGGNIYGGPGSTINLEQGTISDGVAENGGNIYLDGAAAVIGKASGEGQAVVVGGKACLGGNIYSHKDVETGDKMLKILPTGVVADGQALAADDTAPMGGNIYSANNVWIEGTVSGGKADDGGNVYALAWIGVWGTVSNGEASHRGGNIFAIGSVDVVGEKAVIENGKAVYGGNILGLYNVNVESGAQVVGGQATDTAGNIYLVAAATVTIKGKVADGAAPNGGNIATVGNSKLNVDGGSLTDGSIKLGANNVFTISGAAKIDSLALTEGQKLTLGEMTEGASVTLEASGVFTEVNEKAVDYAKYFHPVTDVAEVEAHAQDNALFFGIKRYCSDCKTDVMWDVFAPDACTGTKHLIVTADTELASTININAGDHIVIDLNGHSVSLKDSADRMFIVYGTLSVQDSKTGGKMVGRVNASTGDSGLMLLLNPGVLNLYSGTLSGSTAATAIANGGAVYVGSGCTFNMYGGAVADGKATAQGGNVFCQYGTFNMHGGELRNGAANQGGNLYAGSFTMQGGTITGGHTTASGGNIYLTGTATVKGATITGGVGTTGGNICLQGTTTAYTNLQVTDSTISGGQATSTAAWSGGGNIVAYNANITLTGTRVEGGSAGLCGGNILVGNASLTLAEGSVSHGGTLTATSGTKLGPNICKFDSGDLKILSGATVSGDWMWMNNSTSTTAKLVMEGNINVYFEVGAGPIDATVSGAVKVQSLVLPTGCKLTLGELTEGASIKVTASGVFTNASDKAEEYKKYFLPAEKITVVGNALSMGA